jgi:serine/threonine-protein kinase HipA
MPGSLGVWLGNRRIGTLTNLPGDYNLFAFDDTYLDDDNPPVLSQSFIRSSGATVRVIPRTHRISPPFFANLLPEEGALLRAIVARQQKINRTRDFPFFAAVGLDLPGAVIIRDAESVDLDEDDGAAPETGAPGEHPLRFSLAGMQPKFSASMTGDRLTLPVRGIGGDWIAKLPTNAWRRLPENEYAVMSLARAIGLDVPRAGLFDLDSIEGLPEELPVLRTEEPRIVYAIARFDRLAGGGRVHVEDFNQIAGQPPADKYDHKSTDWIANVIATLCPTEDVDEFVRRVVFGVCVGNNDMHLKNWAVTYPAGRNARLAPMYDFVCTRAYYPAAALALAVGGERAFERIDRAALRAFAQRAEISAKRTLIVADETVAALRDAWPHVKETIADATLSETLERQFAVVPLMNSR